jgi:hypothetical protein
VGTDALPVQVGGNYNTAVGRVALYKNINGGYNTAIGNGALFSNLGGANNVAVGESALANSLGSFNIGLGMEAGASSTVGQNTTGASSIFLGFQTKSLGNAESNQIVIGHQATGLGSNSVVLGNASITTTALRGNVGIGTTAPGSTLSVVGNGSFRNTGSTVGSGYAIEFDTNSSLPRFSFVFNSAYASVMEQGSDSLRFKTLAGGITNITFGSNASSNQVVLKTDTGNLGIGTTAPSQKLDVAGAVSAGSSTNGYQLTNGTTRVSGWGNNQGSNGGLGLSSTFVLGWSSGADGGNFGTFDTILQRDGETDHLAMRRTTNGQKFSVYGTYPGADTWERFTITAPTFGNVLLGTYKGTGGIARGLELQTDGVTRMTLAAGGGITIPFSGGPLTIASDINGQRDIYCGTGRYFRFNNTTATSSAGAGILLFEDISASNATPRFQIGGTSASFPALKRSSTSLQAVLANDSGFTNIQGKLTTDTDYTATVVTPTGFLTLYDAQGTAYRVPCVLAP